MRNKMSGRWSWSAKMLFTMFKRGIFSPIPAGVRVDSFLRRVALPLAGLPPSEWRAKPDQLREPLLGTW